MKQLLILIKLTLSISVFIPWASFAETNGSIELSKDPQGRLTLNEAVALALMHHPQLAVFTFEKRAREARALQSGLMPNPQLGVMVEDVLGSGGFNGFSQSQTTIQLSQLIELGGKRAARLRANTLSTKLADWDYETKRIDVLTQVAKAYVRVLKAQQKITLTGNLVRLGKKFLTAVDERVKAGKVASIEATKAGVSLSYMQIELEKAKRELKVARRNLSATWGNTIPQFESVLGDLFSIFPVPTLENVMGRITNNPDLARWVTELDQRQAALDSQLAKSIPNVTLKGGFRRLEITNDNAITFGISIPLQFFNQNQGRIEEARHMLGKVQAQKRVTSISVRKKLLEAYNTLVFSKSQVISIKTQVLPGALKAFDGVNEGYRFGKFGYLDVLDSQKIFFKAKSQYLDSLANYHMAIVDIERLTGEPLTSFNLPALKPERESVNEE
jgi:cobalt-zinc-cadmium efflux system outer membrane protein